MTTCMIDPVLCMALFVSDTPNHADLDASCRHGTQRVVDAMRPPKIGRRIVVAMRDGHEHGSCATGVLACCSTAGRDCRQRILGRSRRATVVLRE